MVTGNTDANIFLNKLHLLGQKINSRSVNERLGRKCREIIYRRVKSGYGVSNDRSAPDQTTKTKLKPLSASYIAYRSGKVRFYKAKDGHVYPVTQKDLADYVIGGKTTKGRGRFGRGAQTKIRFGRGSAFNKNFLAPVLGPFGRPGKSNATLTGQMMESLLMSYDDTGFKIVIPATPRKTEEGKKPLTNKQVAEYYSKDRPFFALTAGEVRILSRELDAIIKQLVEQIF